MKPDLFYMEALFNEVWLMLMGKLCFIRLGWCQYGALPNDTWLTSV